MANLYRLPQYRTTTLSVPGGITNSQTTGIILADLPADLDVAVPGVLALTWSNPVDEDSIEYITYTSINSGTKEVQGVTRGAEGFSARTHNNQATVAWVVSKSHVNNLVDRLEGTDTNLVRDPNGNEIFLTTYVASAVNYVRVKNAATGNGPELQALGDDTNIDLALQAKGTGAYAFKGTATSAAEARLYEDTDNGTNYIGLKAPASISANKTFVLPDADGTVDQVLKTDGSGNLGWATMGGWTTYSTVTPTSGTLDDPSFELVFAGVDLTSVIGLGMRIRITQSTVKYFIVTKIAFSTDTTITVYGGQDYDLVSTGTTAISAFAYSPYKAPIGFPLEQSKWYVETINNGNSTQGSPTASQWYNLGSLNIVVPIGAWDAYYFCSGFMDKNVAGNANASMTLSTANNSESDSEWTTRVQGTSIDTIVSSMHARKYLEVTSKTTYYLNGMSDTTAASDSLGNQRVVIRIVSAYL